MTDFSSLERKNVLKEMAAETLDLLVIGGGITGAGILLDAKTRGLNCGLIEMQDYAAGTSSRSTKLVHGGLRYLKQFEVNLVAEVGKERAIVYELAPHVTTPEWMLLPLYKGGTFGKFSTSIGLKVYDNLARVRKSERRTMLSRDKTIEKEPLLKKDDLVGGGYYVEYRTDDSRLTLEVMKEAVQRGAKAVNYVKGERLLYEDGKIVGVVAVDQLTGEETTIRAKKIVNAAGPWVDDLREKDNSKQGKYLHITKGIHIVFDQSCFPLKQAVYFDVPDGRMVFAIPRDGKAYVGTTDTDYNADLVHPRMTVADRDYLVEAVNNMFPTLKLTVDDVESSWAGVRPLIHEQGKDPSEISRKDEIFHSPSGLISIAGGKLTGYRKMAERVVDLVTSELTAEGVGSYSECVTDKVKLSGGDVGGSDHLPQFVAEKTKQGVALGLDGEEAQLLAKRYGSNVDELFKLVETVREEAAERKLPVHVLAMLKYGMGHEMTMTPCDFFLRRTSDLLFNINAVHEWKDGVIAYMAEQLGWSEVEEERHRGELERELHDAAVPLEN